MNHEVTSVSPTKKLLLVALPLTAAGAVGLYAAAAYARSRSVARTGRSRVFFDRDGAEDGRTYEAELFDDSRPGASRYCARFTFRPGWTAPPEVFDQCAPTFDAAQALLKGAYERAGFTSPFE